MPSFLEQRTTRQASELKGPRVYSTDLLPSLFDRTNPDLTVSIAARALKIKIVTKGTVTLNCAHLITPMSVKLLDRHPDLFDGNALLPAFRVGKTDLRELNNIPEDEFQASGIDAKRLDDHISMLDENIKTVMPWELGKIAETFRSSVLSGLSTDTSVICKQLDKVGFKSADRARVIADVEKMDLTESETIRRYVESIPPKANPILQRYISTCYHMVGTGVVRCETGTDLSPLSHFKAADVVLASSDADVTQLSDTGIFLRAFMGHALDTIQAAIVPTQIIDQMSFRDSHALSAALREQGFQQKYEDILEQCAKTLGTNNPEEALDTLDPDAVSHAATQIATEFQRYIAEELDTYWTREHGINVAERYRAITDIALHGAGAIPVLGHVVAAGAVLIESPKLVKATRASYRTRKTDRAFEAARDRRENEIKQAIRALSTSESKKSKLLNTVAALSDIYSIRIRRA